MQAFDPKEGSTIGMLIEARTGPGLGALESEPAGSWVCYSPACDVTLVIQYELQTSVFSSEK